MENDKAFYERRMREELYRAGSTEDSGLSLLHRRWAELYRLRLVKLNDTQFDIAA